MYFFTVIFFLTKSNKIVSLKHFVPVKIFHDKKTVHNDNNNKWLILV